MPSKDQLWPDARGVHATACVVDPECELATSHQKIIVFWGEGLDAIHVDDIWLLHVATMSWEKVWQPVVVLWSLCPRPNLSCVCMFFLLVFCCCCFYLIFIYLFILACHPRSDSKEIPHVL